MSQYPKEILTLIARLKKLPGVGRKTAERFAFSFLDWSDSQLEAFADQLAKFKKNLFSCRLCGCLTAMEELVTAGGSEQSPCPFCDPSLRDGAMLCLVASAKDVYAIEETGAFKGVYHVLGGLLSPMEGRGIETLQLDSLEKRIKSHSIREVILALDSTLEGDATALFLRERLEQMGIEATRLAFGLPMGSALDFVDYGTLQRAILGRHRF